MYLVRLGRSKWTDAHSGFYPVALSLRRTRLRRPLLGLRFRLRRRPRIGSKPKQLGFSAFGWEYLHKSYMLASVRIGERTDGRDAGPTYYGYLEALVCRIRASAKALARSMQWGKFFWSVHWLKTTSLDSAQAKVVMTTPSSLPMPIVK